MNQINIATTSNRHRPNSQLLVIDTAAPHPINHVNRQAFVDQFRAGDVIVVNAAATLPASFSGHHQPSERPIELRLAQSLNPGISRFTHWKGVLFGAGDWHLKTEDRTDIPDLVVGDRLIFDHQLQAEILHISAENGRLIEIAFIAEPDKLLHQLYQAGRLIQYSYHEEALDLWDGQTIFASTPIALEAPSASFSITWEMVLGLQRKGVHVVSLIHAAGISSTGEAELDQLLPLPEYYHIPVDTAAVVNQAKRDGRRVIALGTSVTRALESAADDQHHQIEAGNGIATLRLSPDYQRQIVTGLFTGMHEDGTSHLQLLQAFAPWPVIETAYDQAKQRGYLWHEYGDTCLILA